MFSFFVFVLFVFCFLRRKRFKRIFTTGTSGNSLHTGSSLDRSDLPMLIYELTCVFFVFYDTRNLSMLK